MIPPVADRRSGVVFSIRRQRMARVTKEQLVEWHTATPEMLDFLTLCVNHGVSVGLAGKTGSGKTTDIAFLLNAADKDQRIYTIEETRELDLFSEDKNGKAQNRVIHTCTRPSEMQSADIDMNDLLRKAMRFSPDIIAVADMRGAEAMVAQEAARTGQAIPVMVFKRQFPDGTRRVMEIVEATGIENGVVQANTLYRFEAETGEYIREHGVSDELAETLRGNGADKAAISRFREEKT
jgi:pilus assembly protein CpaF